MQLTWLGHSSVKLTTNNHVIYIDPAFGPEELYTKASIILITRWHHDHCRMQAFKKIYREGTRVLSTPETCKELYPSEVLHVGETKTIDGVEIHGMPVLNTRPDQRAHVHEKTQELGFLITAENKRVYHMGDSDFETEMMKAKPDVLLISVGGTHTLPPEDAAHIADLLQPEMAIPIHWGSTEGTLDNAELFKELTKTPATILQPGQSVTV